jgi:general secretion pathway protein D
MTARRRGALVSAMVVALIVGIPTFGSAQGAASGQTLTFANARLADVIRSLGTMLELSLVLRDIPDTRVDFSTTRPVRTTELGEVLEGFLESNGLVLVRRGAVSLVTPADKAPPATDVRVGFEPPPAGTVGLVTQLVPLTTMRADEGLDVVKAIAGPTARLEVVTRSNALLISDRAVNVGRYLSLLKALDEKPTGESGLRTYVVRLKFAEATDLASALGQLYGVPVAFNGGGSLADRSLSRSLGAFRDREMDTFRVRQQIPTMAMSPGALTPAPRDSGGPARPGALVGQTTIVPHLPSNAIILRTAPPNFPLLQETIEALDQRPKQVLFEVTIAEVALGRGNEFGIDWSATNKSGDGNAQFGSPFSFDSTQSVGGLVVRAVRLGKIDVQGILRAVASTSTVRVLSTPQVLAVNNREATINVGSKFPFIASTRLGDNIALDRAVQYQDVGTKLTIIPTINDDNVVSVQLLQEVSSVTTQTVTGAFDAPVITTREASTRAVLRDGQTAVIAGLIGDSREVTTRGIPLLADIPWLGNLFKRRTENRQRTELAIFITPYVVQTDAEAGVLRDRIRDRLEKRSPGALDDTPVKRPPGGTPP